MPSRLISWSALLLIAISLISGFYIIKFLNNQGLNLAIEAPAEVYSGVPFDLKVNFSNDSNSVLDNVRLALSLPEGAAFFGNDAGKTLDNKFLGNVGEGSLIQQSYKVIVFGAADASKQFKATINYSTASLGASFEKSKTLDLNVKSAGVALDLAVPDKLVSGEEFETSVVYRNVSEIDFSDLELKLEYPPSFNFINSSLKPDTGNNIWLLGDLRKNSEGKFTIRGSLIGGEGDAFSFKSNLATRNSGQTYLISENSATTTIASSPLSLSIHLNGDPDYVAKSGDNLNYTLSYVNSSNVPLRDVVVRAQLIGEMFDFVTLPVSGFFRTQDNILIWNSGSAPALAVLAPGSAGTVNFTVKVKDNYPIRRFSDKNFLLKVNGEIESPTIPPSMTASRLLSKVRLETKVSGKVAVDAKVYFRDADSGFLNRGPLPPKAGQATNFTVHWLLKSFASDFSNVEIRSFLGKNVKLVDTPKSNSGGIPFYDSGANEMVWQVGKIQANQGVISSPIEAVFQIEADPSAENVGTYMQLVGETSIKALDDFSGRELTDRDAAITSALPDDITVGQQGGVVQP